MEALGAETEFTFCVLFSLTDIQLETLQSQGCEEGHHEDVGDEGDIVQLTQADLRCQQVVDAVIHICKLRRYP